MTVSSPTEAKFMEVHCLGDHPTWDNPCWYSHLNTVDGWEIRITSWKRWFIWFFNGFQPFEVLQDFASTVVYIAVDPNQLRSVGWSCKHSSTFSQTSSHGSKHDTRDPTAREFTSNSTGSSSVSWDVHHVWDTLPKSSQIHIYRRPSHIQQSPVLISDFHSML